MVKVKDPLQGRLCQVNMRHEPTRANFKYGVPADILARLGSGFGHVELEKLQRLFQEINTLRNEEKNIFSIGGRGHYENAISDLLSFYLDPSEDHNLGDLVLASLIECLPDLNPSLLALEEPPQRECVTKAGNRIDLILNGSGWVIVLENKLKSGPSNPFAEYRDFVESEKTFKGKQKHFVILAPYRTDSPGWTCIDYRLLAGRIREKLGAQFVVSGISKWILFLREFLMNIEDQLSKDMDDREFKFVGENYSTLVASIKLHDRYIDRLKEIVKSVGRETLGSDPADVKRYSWGKLGIALRMFPMQDRNHDATLLVFPDGGFRIQFNVQQDMKKPEIDRNYFTESGTFVDWTNVSNDKLWSFGNAKDEETLESALARLKQALLLLKDAMQ